MSQIDTIAAVHDSLLKLQATKICQKMLQRNVESLAAQLERASADFRKHPEGFHASELADTAARVADVVAHLNMARSEIADLTRDLEEVHGLSGLVNLE